MHRPQPRVELGLALRGIATAAIDVSDGLLADLGHVLEASKVSADLRIDHLLAPCAEVDLSLPQVRDCVLAGGDDYELAFTAPVERRAAVEALASHLRLALTRFGSIAASGPDRITLRDSEDAPVPLGRLGYDHFR